MKGIFRFLATGLDVGLIPGAPGTYGTLVGVLLYLAVVGLPTYLYILFCITFTFFAVWIAANALPSFEAKDPRQIVIDEIAGFLVAMIGAPFSWLNIAIGFALFRLFDVAKPQPIRYFDRKVAGAWGVVLDDIFAGLFAAVVSFAVRALIKSI